MPTATASLKLHIVKHLKKLPAAGAVEVGGVYYLYMPYDENRATVNPRVGAVYLAGRHFTLKALYGEGFRVPTVREFFSVTSSRYSNPVLAPEKVRTTELSAIYEIPGKGILEVDSFFTAADNIVQLFPGTVKRPGRNAFLNQFQNVGRAHIYGFDLKAQAKLNRKLDLFGYYSFQHPRYVKINPGNLSHAPEILDPTDSSNRIPRQAAHKGTIGVSLRVWNRRLILTPRLNIVGQRPGIITSPLERVPAYASWNLSALLNDVGIKGLYAETTVYNVTNENILDPGFRTANKFDDFPAAHPQPGFNMFSKIGYRHRF